MIEITMTRETIRIDIGQIAGIVEHHTEVEVSMDKIIEDDCAMSITKEMIIEETTAEICKIIEVRIIEVDAEEMIETITLKEVEVGLGTDNIQIISDE